MGKKRILQLGILLVCVMALIVSAQAAEKETVSLTLKDNQVEAKLELPGEPEEDVVSLQLSFRIQGDGGSIKADEIDFAFDAGLPASAIQQCRYQEDTGILSIYISGKENLYKSQDIPLGRVVVNSDRSASVSVVKDSFKTVNSAFGMYEGEVNTGDGGIPINNDPTGDGTENNGNDQTGGASDGSSQGGSGSGGNFAADPVGANPVAGSAGNISAGGSRKPVGTDKKNPVTGTVSGAIDSLLHPNGQGSGSTISPEGGEDGSIGDEKDSSGKAPGDAEQAGAEKGGSSAGGIIAKVLLGLAAVTAAGAAAIGGRVAYVKWRCQRRRRRRMQNQRNRQRMQAGRTAAESSQRTRVGKTAAEGALGTRAERTVDRRPGTRVERTVAEKRPGTQTGRTVAEKNPGRAVMEGTLGTRAERTVDRRPGTRVERTVAEKRPRTQVGRKAAESRPGTRPERTVAERTRGTRSTGTDSRSASAKGIQARGQTTRTTQSTQTAWRQEKPYVRKKRKIG